MWACPGAKGEEEPWGPSYRRTEGLAPDCICLMKLEAACVKTAPELPDACETFPQAMTVVMRRSAGRGRTHAQTRAGPEPDAGAQARDSAATGWCGRRDPSAAAWP